MWQGDPNFNVVLIVAAVFGAMVAFPIIIGILIANNAQKRREAELIRLAIEKGQPVPSFPSAQKPRNSWLRPTLVWIAVGLGVILMSLTAGIQHWEGVSLGLTFMLIGIALGLAGWLISRSSNNGNKQSG